MQKAGTCCLSLVLVRFLSAFSALLVKLVKPQGNRSFRSFRFFELPI